VKLSLAPPALTSVPDVGERGDEVGTAKRVPSAAGPSRGAACSSPVVLKAVAE
jgi:hypothetical protein